jgi:thioredoxin-like negative regulator of GroEL
MDETTALKNRIEKEKALMVYFYNDDCAPCISLRPKVNNLIVNSFPEMKLIFVESRSYPEIPAAFGVYANPAILLFFEGKEYHRFSKFVSMIKLEETIRRFYNMLFEEN